MISTRELRNMELCWDSIFYCARIKPLHVYRFAAVLALLPYSGQDMNSGMKDECVSRAPSEGELSIYHAQHRSSTKGHSFSIYRFSNTWSSLHTENGANLQWFHTPGQNNNFTLAQGTLASVCAVREWMFWNVLSRQILDPTGCMFSWILKVKYSGKVVRGISTVCYQTSCN